MRTRTADAPPFVRFGRICPDSSFARSKRRSIPTPHDASRAPSRWRGRSKHARRPRHQTRRARAQLVGVACALVLAAAASVFTWQARRSAPAAIPFAERDWVLVTAFDNRTGDPSLDGALGICARARAFQLGLRQRRSTCRASKTRLRLMRKPLDTRIDAIVGREVALRDGHIGALIAGRIEKIGGAYSVSARIVRPADGSTAASVNEASISQPDLLRASDASLPASAVSWAKRCRPSNRKAPSSRKWPRSRCARCNSTRRRRP